MSENSESMIERMARAVLAELQDQSCTVEETANLNDVAVEGNHFDLIKITRVAIEAMREPTEAMVDAGREAQGISDADDIVCWDAMIYAALSKD